MRNGIRLAATLSLLSTFPAAAFAFTINTLQSTYTAPTYSISLVALLDAPPQDVEAVLVDYRRYQSLDPRIRSSEVLSESSPDTAVVRTRVRFCAAFFCRPIDRVETVEHRTGVLEATVIPERSQLKRGVTRTTWKAHGAGTLVTYDAEFVPAFRVPDIIARRYATRALRDSTVNLFANIEREANARGQ
jgi:hypothetical protein